MRRANLLMAVVTAGLSSSAARAVDTPATVLLRCHLDKSVARVDEEVRITEVIDRTPDMDVEGPEVKAVSYGVSAVGQFDEQKGRSVVRDSVVPELSAVDHDRVGLVPAILCSGSCITNTNLVATPRTRGREYAFRPYRPGVYLITAFWHLGGKDKDKYGAVVAGSPVVLTVLPKVEGDKGK